MGKALVQVGRHGFVAILCAMPTATSCLLPELLAVLAGTALPSHPGMVRPAAMDQPVPPPLPGTREHLVGCEVGIYASGLGCAVLLLTGPGKFTLQRKLFKEPSNPKLRWLLS